MIKKKQPFTLFSVVAENLTSNELGLKTKKENPYTESTKLVSEKVKERIKEFHDYLENGMPVAKAKKIILYTTTLKDVQKYIENYSNIDSFPQKENAINEILLVVYALQ